MSSLSLLELIPASAAYRRIPLDPRLNALEIWQEAADEFNTPDREGCDWKELFYATQLSAPRMSPANAKNARALLQENTASLEAMSRGLERGQLQFREFQSLGQVPADTEFVSRLGEIARLYWIRFRLRFSEGNFTGAVEDLFSLRQTGWMICHGDGQMLHYLIGLWLRAAAVRGFAHLAGNAQTPRRVLERILETLDEGLTTPDGLAQSLRVDLCTIALAQLDRTVEDPDLEKVVDKVIEVYYAPPHKLRAKARGPENAAIANGCLDECRRQILLLLGDHPKPFDKAATARLMGVIVAETIGDLRHSRWPAFLDVVGQLHGIRRKMRLHRLARKTRFWPVELTPSMRIDVAETLDVKPPQEGEITTVQLPSENLSEAHLRALRGKLSFIDNPVGLMLTEHLMGHDYGPHLLEHLKRVKTLRSLIRQRLAAEDSIEDVG